MKQINFFQRKLKIEESVKVIIEGHIVRVKGPIGKIEKKLAHPNIKIEVKEGNVVLTSKNNSKHDKRLIGTFEAHIKNLIYGIKNGYTTELKICSGHFPMKVTIDGMQVVISNFLGEKIPRKANIIDGANVKLDNDILIVSGVDKEKIGQTAANIERATRITNRDRRVFQDGIYLIR